MLLTYLEIQVRARNIMMADTQTYYLIGRTAKLQLEIYPETGWRTMTCYSHHKF